MSVSSHLSSAEAAGTFDCTAIVPTVDRPLLLEACLASLAIQRPQLCESLVVDQGPGEAEAVARAAGARYLQQPGRGLSRARNAGVAVAVSDWLLFVDDDCVLSADLTTTVARFIASHPEASFLCCRLMTPAGRPVQPDLGTRVRELRTPTEAIHIPGQFFHRRVLEQAGGFDERLGVGARFPSGEETDLLFRALRAGLRGFYVPGAVLIHPEKFDVLEVEERVRRSFEYGRGWGALFAKHGTRPLRPAYLALHARYLTRALGGAVLAALAGRRADARRYVASLHGRWTGFLEYRREGGPEAHPPGAP
jgi:GT2 family glycosyltransferase